MVLWIVHPVVETVDFVPTAAEVASVDRVGLQVLVHKLIKRSGRINLAEFGGQALGSPP